MLQTTLSILGRLAFVLVAVASTGAAAQEWPGSRPVRLVVAALAGSSPDLTARYLADQLTRQTGGSFVVVNKAGGLGIPALTEVTQAAPDGTTLLVGNINTNALAPALHIRKYPFDVKSALRPITMLSDGPSALVAGRNVPSTFSESIAAWKANPGKYAYFAAGAGSFGHIWFAKLLAPQNIDMLFVPVKGGADGLQLLHEGSVQYAYVPVASFIPQMRSKEVQALFVTGQTRLPEFPDVPTLREVGLPADLELNTWVGLFGPAKMKPELVKAIHQAFAGAVKKPEVGALYKKSYMVQSTSASPDEFQAFVNHQIEQFKIAAERARIKVQD
ncbi:MAG TPA: tripartite tricarboxylate transporter substrate binding protein [Ramlibacter sp.]|nr:tripartite tricarboxylate transporter substrate binding protein [Ramlibacter sp.]